jgi:hypothetical protein
VGSNDKYCLFAPLFLAANKGRINTVNIAINPNMPRPLFYGPITGGYHLLGMVLVNLILVVME